jgi:hypothetical protein
MVGEWVDDLKGIESWNSLDLVIKYSPIFVNAFVNKIKMNNGVSFCLLLSNFHMMPDSISKKIKLNNPFDFWHF